MAIIGKAIYVKKLPDSGFLKNTTWIFGNTPNLTTIGNYGDNGQMITASNSFNINFTSNGNQYTTLSGSYVAFEGSPISRIIYDSTTVYTNGWSSTNYKTITITGGIDTNNTELINWLQQNATLQTS